MTQTEYRDLYNIREATPVEIERMSPMCRFYYKLYGRIPYPTPKIFANHMPPPVYTEKGRFRPWLQGMGNLNGRPQRLCPIRPETDMDMEWKTFSEIDPDLSKALTKETLDWLLYDWNRKETFARRAWSQRKDPRCRELIRKVIARALGYRTSISTYQEACNSL